MFCFYLYRPTFRLKVKILRISGVTAQVKNTFLAMHYFMINPKHPALRRDFMLYYYLNICYNVIRLPIPHGQKATEAMKLEKIA